MNRQRSFFSVKLLACRPVIGARGGFCALDPFLRIDGHLSRERTIS